MRTLATRFAASLTVVEVVIDRQPERVAVFALQTVATEIGEGRLTVRVALGGAVVADGVRRQALVTPDLAPYINLLAVSADDLSEVRQWLGARGMAISLAVTPSASNQPAALMDAVLEDLGTSVAIRAWPSSGLRAAAIRALTPLSALVIHEISPLDDEGVE